MKSPHQNVGLWFPEGAKERKEYPVMTGVIDYFPLAVAEVARLSLQGNRQHDLEGPLHWARGKSNDHADCLLRHLMERGVTDTDGFSHTTKAAWRALALLQEELEGRLGFIPQATHRKVDIPAEDIYITPSRVDEFLARNTPDEANYYSQPPERIWPLGPTGEGQE